MPHLHLVPDVPDDPNVRILRRQDGWILPDYSDYAGCCINAQPPNGPQCTATAVWKVVRDHDMHQTLTWWCEQHLPAEHRNRIR